MRAWFLGLKNLALGNLEQVRVIDWFRIMVSIQARVECEYPRAEALLV